MFYRVFIITSLILFLYLSCLAGFIVDVDKISQLRDIAKRGNPTAVCLSSDTSNATEIREFVKTSHKVLPRSLVGIRWRTLSSLGAFPPALGAVSKVDLVEEYALTMARFLHDIGIDFVYGLPITYDPEKDRYGLSSSPFRSATILSIFIRAFRAYGILSVVKGFPTSFDEKPLSHLAISKSAFENSVLLTFRSLKTRTHIDAIELEPVYLDFLDSKRLVALSDIVKRYIYREIGRDIIFITNVKGLNDKRNDKLSEMGLVNVGYLQYMRCCSRERKVDDRFENILKIMSYGKKIFGNVRDDVKALDEVKRKIDIASITLMKWGRMISKPERIYIWGKDYDLSIGGYNVRYNELFKTNFGERDVLILLIRNEDELKRVQVLIGKRNVVSVFLFPLTPVSLDLNKINSLILVYRISPAVIEKIIQTAKGQFHPSGVRP